jgi:hypothetical protein
VGASKTYTLWAQDRPMLFIQETFNPALIPTNTCD